MVLGRGGGIRQGVGRYGANSCANENNKYMNKIYMTAYKPPMSYGKMIMYASVFNHRSLTKTVLHVQ